MAIWLYPSLSLSWNLSSGRPPPQQLRRLLGSFRCKTPYYHLYTYNLIQPSVVAPRFPASREIFFTAHDQSRSPREKAPDSSHPHKTYAFWRHHVRFKGCELIVNDTPNGKPFINNDGSWSPVWSIVEHPHLHPFRRLHRPWCLIISSHTADVNHGLYLLQGLWKGIRSRQFPDWFFVE